MFYKRNCVSYGTLSLVNFSLPAVTVFPNTIKIEKCLEMFQECHNFFLLGFLREIVIFQQSY